MLGSKEKLCNKALSASALPEKSSFMPNFYKKGLSQHTCWAAQFFCYCLSIGEEISAMVASVVATKSAGRIRICKPLTPALMYINSCSEQVEWMKVGKRFFIPIGEQPPRI